MRSKRWSWFFNFWQIVKKSELSLLAPGLAFTTVLSIIPMLAVGLSVFQFFGGLNSLYRGIEPLILKHFLAGSGNEVAKAVQTTLGRVHFKTLGVLGVLGLLIASLNLFYQMDVAVQKIWGAKRTRTVFTRIAIYSLILLSGPLLVSAFIGFAGSINADISQIRKLLPSMWVIWPFVFLTLFCIYKYVPAVKVSTAYALRSALWASLAFQFVQHFYKSFTKSILQTNAIYGGLASIPAFLLWILILWWICLSGVALTCAFQRAKEEHELEALKV